MDNAQELLFAAIFALLLAGLAVYFVYLIRSTWQRIGSVFFRTAVVAGCTWVWSLGAAGFSEYCGSWARACRHTRFAYDLRQVCGLFLFISLATFVISVAALIIGITESALRGRRPSNQTLQPTDGRSDA